MSARQLWSNFVSRRSGMNKKCGGRSVAPPRIPEQAYFAEPALCHFSLLKHNAYESTSHALGMTGAFAFSRALPDKSTASARALSAGCVRRAVPAVFVEGMFKKLDIFARIGYNQQLGDYHDYRRGEKPESVSPAALRRSKTARLFCRIS